MTQVEIIYMAREAGLGWAEGLGGMPEFLERFAKLVAQHEREACVKACEAIGQHNIINQCVDAIRARGDNK
jgi:hypothetical protein